MPNIIFITPQIDTSNGEGQGRAQTQQKRTFLIFRGEQVDPVACSTNEFLGRNVPHGPALHDVINWVNDHDQEKKCVFHRLLGPLILSKIKGTKHAPLPLLRDLLRAQVFCGSEGPWTRKGV